MKFVLQVSTGSFAQCSVSDIGTMKMQTEELLKRLPVSRIIFGWGIRPGLPEVWMELAEKYGVQMLLWLPVLADTEQPDSGDPLKPIRTGNAKRITACPGEEFRFMCPNSDRNLERTMASYDRFVREYPADGVFLDRIRYPSAVYSHYDFFGCHCERCGGLYRKAGIDEDRLFRKVCAEGSLASFLPSCMENGRYHYEDKDAELLCGMKRLSILRLVQKLTNHFHQMGLIVGIDAFAPCLADCVGQDLERLSEIVDFIKPMMYYRTTAPAGVPYEMAAYGDDFTRRLSEMWGADVGQPSSMEMQLRSLKGKASILPGIEVNSIPGICEPNEAGFTSSLRAISNAGCEEAVLCWNVLQAPETNIRSIENALSAIQDL